MRFDAIIVPRGPEARAVSRGWSQPRPAMFFVPAGVAAGGALNDGRPIETALVLGVCGALDPALRIGDVVVYAGIVDGAATIDLDPELAAQCAQRCATPVRRALNVQTVVGDVAAKRALRETTGAAAVDMEGAAIARALHARRVRVAMVRVVSDDAQSELPDLRTVYDARGTLRPFAFALALARTPRRSAQFIANALKALAALRSTAKRLSI